MTTAAARLMIPDPLAAFIRSSTIELVEGWGALVSNAASAPHFTWEDWKEAILLLVETPDQELLVRGALSALIKTADTRTVDQMLAALLALTIRAAKPDFRFPPPAREEADMP